MTRPLRVAILGPESTGKTTLARDLAAHYGTTWAPEYLRRWVDEHPGREPMVAFTDTVDIARGHAAGEDAAAEKAHRVVFLDTDAITSLVYSDHYFGRVHPDLAALADARPSDRALLLAPDVPWVPDAQRDNPLGRGVIFEAFRRALESRGRRYVVISGADWKGRFDAAVRAVDGLLGTDAR